MAKKKGLFMKYEVLTAKQLAEYFQMDERTIYRLARAGKIPSVKVARQWRFKKDLIDRWLEEQSEENLNKGNPV